MILRTRFILELWILTILWHFSYGSCDNGWYENSSSCYYFSNNNVTWYEANTICQQMDANLASILSTEEGDFIATVWNISSADYWIGLKTKKSSTNSSWVWMWVDGHEVGYNPISLNGTEDSEYCARIFSQEDWRKTACGRSYDDYPFHFICKKGSSGRPEYGKVKGPGSALYISVGVILVAVLVAVVLAAVVIYFKRKKTRSQFTAQSTNNVPPLSPSEPTLEVVYDEPTEHNVQASDPTIEGNRQGDIGHENNTSDERRHNEHGISGRRDIVDRGRENNGLRNNRQDDDGDNRLDEHVYTSIRTKPISAPLTRVDNPIYDRQDDVIPIVRFGSGTNNDDTAMGGARTDPANLELHDNPNYQSANAEESVTDEMAPPSDLNDLEMFENMAYENRTVY